MTAFSEKDARTRLLLGDKAFSRLENAFVAIAGLGGVGGCCAEALARSGVGRLHLIDADAVTESNLNRQLVATYGTVGMKKVLAMRERLLSVSDCEITVSDAFLSAETVPSALPDGLSAIADAIDFVPGKVALAKYAAERGIPIVSCMGAGNRLDPTAFSVTDLFETSGCPLARKLRQEMRKAGICSLPVVFSSEKAISRPGQTEIGSIAPVTASAGLLLAMEIIKRIAGAAAPDGI